MPSLFPFVGARLALQSVQFLSPIRLRVRFLSEPVQTSPYGTNDALNPANYSLGGPGSAAVVQVIPVPGDSLAFNLEVSSPMLTGTWTLTVTNIQTPTSASLVSPTSLSFASTYLVSTDTNPGAVQQGAYGTLRKHLNSVFVGPKWTALLSAISSEDDRLSASARAAFDQLFVTTASGVYLRDRASDRGVSYPTGVGLSDFDFRNLITAISNEKLTEEAFLQILEVFFGKTKLRAWVETETAETWTIPDGATLTVGIDGQEFPLIFREFDFLSATSAGAAEVAISMTKQLRLLGCSAWAEVATSTTGQRVVRLFSPSKGLRSSVEIRGGTAQGVLFFPSVRMTNVLSRGVVTGGSWVISSPQPNVMRLRLTDASSVDLSSVVPGDYLLVQGSGFATLNRGSWVVLSVDRRVIGGLMQQTVDVTNTTGIFPQAGVSITAGDDLLFFAKARAGTKDVVVAHATPGTAEILVPATAEIVSRSMGRAAYLQAPATLSALSIRRMPTGLATVDFGATHGLQVDDWVIVDDFQPQHALPSPSIAGLPTLPTSPVSFLSEGTDDAGHYFGTSLTLSDGMTVFSVGGVSGGSTTTTARRWTTTGPTTVDGVRKYEESTPATANAPNAAYLQASSLLSDGRVLVTGGRPASTGNVTDLTACYNPTGNSWTTPDKLGTERAWHFQVSLPDGRVLVGGGVNGLPGALSTLSSCELFTYNGSGGGTWANTASMATARIGASAVLLQDGRVLVCGGNTSTLTNYSSSNFDNPHNSCEIFDPATNTWAQTGKMNLRRTRHDAVVLPDGRVLVVGGATAEPSAPTTVSLDRRGAEIWSPTSGRWSLFPTPFSLVWLRLLLDPQMGRVYAIGGYNSSSFGAEIWYLDLQTMVWHAAPQTSLGNVWGSLGMRSDGTFFLVGGAGQAGPTVKKFLFIPASDLTTGRGINGLQKIVSTTTTTITFDTGLSAYSYGESGVVMPMSAPESQFPGPYAMDPLSFTLGKAASQTTSAIQEGRGNQKVFVQDVSRFPGSGLAVLGFGSDSPVIFRYVDVVGNALILDASSPMPRTLPAGTPISEVASAEPFDPTPFPGVFYLTGGTQGRIAAVNLLQQVKAAGLPLSTTVSYPGDRGLAGEGLSISGNGRLSEQPFIWGGDE